MTDGQMDTEHYTHKHEMLLAFDEQKKQASIAMNLLFFFGFIGAHRFYLGHVKMGIGIIAGTISYIYI